MRIRELIREFDTREDVPIEVDDVVDFLKANNIKDEINFVGVDINTEVLRGSIHHFVVPGLGYGEPTHCADIFYSQGQSGDWQRLVCCKELLHLLDPDAQKVKSKADFLKQIEKIILPAEFQDPVADGAKVWSDRLATYFAVAVLFPWAARELLIEQVKDGKLTIEDVARLVDIPERYVALVFSEDWVTLHKLMIA